MTRARPIFGIVALMMTMMTAVGFPCVASAGTVVVLPIVARNVPYETVRALSEHIAETVRVLGREVVDEAVASRSLGVDLGRHVASCQGDIFCLVEFGGVVRAERLLVGQIARVKVSSDETLYELRLSAIDVARARIHATLVWRSSSIDGLAVFDMAAAAAHQLVGPPDVRLVFDLEPKDMTVTVYGDRIRPPEDRSPMPYWSGVYEAVFEREGYVAERVRSSWAPSTEVIRVAVTLDPDPLFVGRRSGIDPVSASPSSGAAAGTSRNASVNESTTQAKSRPNEVDRKRVDPFGVASRRPGSGVSALDVARSEALPAPQSRRAFEQPYAWTIMAAGVAVGVFGGVLKAGAQAEYNTMAGDLRYVSGGTLPADEARALRAAAETRAKSGGVLIGVGVGAVVSAVGWLVLDVAMSGARDADVGRRADAFPRGGSP